MPIESTSNSLSENFLGAGKVGFTFGWAGGVRSDVFVQLAQLVELGTGPQMSRFFNCLLLFHALLSYPSGFESINNSFCGVEA